MEWREVLLGIPRSEDGGRRLGVTELKRRTSNELSKMVGVV